MTENAYKSPTSSSQKATPAIAVRDNRRFNRIVYARAAICVAWLPALGLITFFGQTFEDLFSSLREKGELPALTEWLLRFAWLNEGLYYLPTAIVLVLLILADIGIANLLQGSSRRWLYWIWFGGVVVMGIVAAAMVTTALLLPVLRMSGSI